MVAPLNDVQRHVIEVDSGAAGHDGHTSAEMFERGPFHLDFRRGPAAFVDLAAYDAYYPYYVSPLDLFVPGERQAIAAKTGSVFGNRLRSAEPIGGTYMQDLAGTAQGNWFLPGRYHANSTDLSGFLGLAHDYVDPAQPLIAVGTSIAGMTPGLLSYTPQASGLDNRDFKAIGNDGQVYCLDRYASGQSAGGLPLSVPAGVLLLELPDATTLRAEWLAGATCASLTQRSLGSRATRFVRGPSALGP